MQLVTESKWDLRRYLVGVFQTVSYRSPSDKCSGYFTGFQVSLKIYNPIGQMESDWCFTSVQGTDLHPVQGTDRDTVCCLLSGFSPSYSLGLSWEETCKRRSEQFIKKSAVICLEISTQTQNLLRRECLTNEGYRGFSTEPSKSCVSRINLEGVGKRTTGLVHQEISSEGLRKKGEKGHMLLSSEGRCLHGVQDWLLMSVINLLHYNNCLNIRSLLSTGN